MNQDNTEHSLKVLFRELRHVEETKAPTFAAILGREHAWRSSRWARPLALSLGGAAICMILAVLFIVSRQRSSSDEEFVTALRTASTMTSWNPPTDILLEPPQPGLIRDVPSIGETFYDMSLNIQ